MEVPLQVGLPLGAGAHSIQGVERVVVSSFFVTHLSFSNRNRRGGPQERELRRQSPHLQPNPMLSGRGGELLASCDPNFISSGP